ncbi:hypothetical protein GCM10022261_08000 [Brevibacterium daeguense]|uniref:Uncharacterized protein n=1 Tax=Brevibacterium daeguense TaxID=909936 RepID=A0ABP8EH27_9MICO|nr:hypothetical protein [Brevibacterium daeguense]
MDWQAIAAIITGLGVIASFITTWWALRHDRMIAESQAERAEAAARLNEKYTQRIVDALEAIAQTPKPMGALGGGGRVRWSLDGESGDAFRLANTGTTTAFDVSVAGHESLIGPDDIRGGPHLRPGDALTFSAARTPTTADSTITVSWADFAGAPDRSMWQYPLPPAQR